MKLQQNINFLNLFIKVSNHVTVHLNQTQKQVFNTQNQLVEQAGKRVFAIVQLLVVRAQEPRPPFTVILSPQCLKFLWFNSSKNVPVYLL